MKHAVNILLFLGTIALAFWAYRENYATQAVIAETRQLHRDIARSRDRLAVLRAEWAYLNRPERLRDLVELNDEDLPLMPLTAEHFGRVDQIAYRLPDVVPLSEPIPLSSIGGGQ